MGLHHEPVAEAMSGTLTPLSPLDNDCFLRALAREPVPHTPVWLMRQAGRYLPEYKATRERAGSFLGLAKNPDYATEVTLQPLARFPLDAAILFSDILTVPDAMGLGLYFAEGEGPRFERPLRDEAAIRALAVPDPNAELRYVMDAVRSIRKALAGRVPLIGFSGSPYTLACYMIEGGGSDDFRNVKRMLYGRPDLLTQGDCRTQEGKRRPARAQHPVHQGRRAVAGVHGRHRLRRTGRGLEHRPRPGARARGFSRGPARQPRSGRPVRTGRARAPRSPTRARRLRRPARPHLQSRSRHIAVHAAGERRGTGG
jgi:hypothetical protein